MANTPASNPTRRRLPTWLKVVLFILLLPLAYVAAQYLLAFLLFVGERLGL
jgi:hypothetical protein